MRTFPVASDDISRWLAKSVVDHAIETAVLELKIP
jgi:hypothetical protein